jgi:long-chain acyl-CoA synthetase
VSLGFLLTTFESSRDLDAVIWRSEVTSYDRLLALIQSSEASLEQHHAAEGSVVLLEADLSPQSLAMLLALMQRHCIVVPLTQATPTKREQYERIAEAEVRITIDEGDRCFFEHTHTTARHELVQQLRQANHPGLILFSSGVTGQPKAVVHDLALYVERFNKPGHRLRTLNFLLFDHVAGLNTLFYTLAQAGCVVTIQDRSPDAVLRTIEKQRVQLLPTSPTFINLMLLSGAHQHYDLSSLELVTYGSEVMPESTLAHFRSAFPAVNIFQQYGLSEMGVARSKSKSPDSVWVKLKGPDFDVRVRDGMLEVKSSSAMLGYLNAESPFTEDGWFKTGDAVEVDGDYLRILGRKSEMINVGGEKVFPAEVESVLLEMPGVADVSVAGVPNPITGSMVKAAVKLSTDESSSEFSRRMRQFCKDRLPSYKIPQKVVLMNDDLHSERFKKMRGAVTSSEL